MSTTDHGIRAAYIAGCRCQPCTQANRAYTNEWRARSIDLTHSHGFNGYANYQCRCEVCKQAAKDYRRARRDALKAKVSS